jgi:hypothetical protein
MTDIDLNFQHTSKPKRTAEAIAAARDASEAINIAIDDGIQRGLKTDDTRRFNISPSGVGGECMRQFQFQITGVPSVLASRTHRIFERGNLYEDVVAEWLRQGGFHLKTVDENGQQFGFQLAKGNIRGRIDGIILDGPKIRDVEYACLWECKVLGDKGWKNLVAKGVFEAYPKYAAQIALYQAYKELETPAMLTALNINTMELHHEMVPFNQELAQRMSDRAVDVLIACQTNTLMERAGGSPDGYPCRFCDFSDHCWNDGGLGPKRPAR